MLLATMPNPAQLHPAGSAATALLRQQLCPTKLQEHRPLKTPGRQLGARWRTIR